MLRLSIRRKRFRVKIPFTTIIAKNAMIFTIYETNNDQTPLFITSPDANKSFVFAPSSLKKVDEWQVASPSDFKGKEYGKVFMFNVVNPAKIMDALNGVPDRGSVPYKRDSFTTKVEPKVESQFRRNRLHDTPHSRDVGRSI